MDEWYLLLAERERSDQRFRDDLQADLENERRSRQIRHEAELRASVITPEWEWWR